MLGMSQEKLGESFGIIFQQIQKYEKGMNCVGVSCLQNILNIFNVLVFFFFEDVFGDMLFGQFGMVEVLSFNYVVDFLLFFEGFQLNCVFVKINDVKVCCKLVEFVKVFVVEVDVD